MTLAQPRRTACLLALVLGAAVFFPGRSFGQDEPDTAPAEPPAMSAEEAAVQEWFLRIDAVKARGDDARVVQLCGEALKQFPGNQSLLNAKATAQARVKDYKGALATATEALAADPKNVTAHANAAFARAGLGDQDGMIASLRAAAAVDPRYQDALRGALAGDAVGYFSRMSAPPAPKKPVPMYVWILIPAAAGFLLMILLALAAGR